MGLFSKLQDNLQTKKTDKLYSDGKLALNCKNYEKALECFEQAAQAGHPDAQYQCGYLYMNGLGTPEDAEKAVSWLEKADANGHKDAAWYLVRHYRYTDTDKAYQWIRKCFEEQDKFTAYCEYTEILIAYGKLHNDAKAVYDGALFMEKKHSIRKEQILELLEQAAGLGLAEAQLRCAKIYDEGRGVKEDAEAPAKKPSKNKNAKKKKTPKDPRGNTPKERAFYWYLQAAEQGVTEAMVRCAKMYYNGEGTKPDDEKACFWAKKAQEAGSRDTESILKSIGRSHNLEDGLASYQSGDYERALPLLLQAARSGSLTAQLLCGKMYLKGLGTKIDKAEALSWYQAAGLAMHIPHIAHLGGLADDLLSIGLGLFSVGEYDSARDLLEAAAQEGRIYAFLPLAAIYRHGTESMAPDPKEASRLLKRWKQAFRPGDTVYFGLFPQEEVYPYYELDSRRGTGAGRSWEIVRWEVLDIQDDRALLITEEGLLLSGDNYSFRYQELSDLLFSPAEQALVASHGLLRADEFRRYAEGSDSLQNPASVTIFARSHAVENYAAGLSVDYDGKTFSIHHYSETGYADQDERERRGWSKTFTQSSYSWWLDGGHVSSGKVQPGTEFKREDCKVAAIRYAAWIKLAEA